VEIVQKGLAKKRTLLYLQLRETKKGKVVSGPREIRELLAREYKDRLRSRPVRPGLEKMKKRKGRIFKMLDSWG
jgi:hypothetical protein